MTKEFSQAEFDADAKRLGLTLNVIAEEHAPDFKPRPFSVDIGDFDEPEKKESWQERIPVVPAPEQESLWPFYLEVAWKLFATFVFIVGLAFLVTGPHF